MYFELANAESWKSRGYTIECRRIVVPASTFIAPGDVVFRELQKSEDE